MLEFFNNKFMNSSKKVKIELFFLPLLVFILIYLFPFSNNEIKPQTISKINFTLYENRSFDGSFNELFSLLEKLAKENNLLIFTNTRKEKIILLKGEGEKNDILTFIKRVENINDFTKIDTLILNQKAENKKLLFDIKIDLNKFFVKNIIKEESKKTEIETNNLINKELKLTAIIAGFVMINENWIQINEEIDSFKLIKIDKNFVVLKNENEEIKLELQDESYIRKID